MRGLLAVILGVVVALAVQTGADWVANQFYPAAITDMWDRGQISEAYAARPVGALLIGILGFFLAGLIGGYAGKRVAGRDWAAWVPAAVLALMALLIVFSFPIQTWAAFAMLIAPLIGGLIANHLVATQEPAEAVVAPDTDT